MHKAHVGPGGGGDHPRRRGRQRLHSGPARGGPDEFAQQREFTVGVDKVAYGVRTAGATVGCAGGHW